MAAIIKTQRMQELEAKHGKPIERVVTEAFDRTGSVWAASLDLGVDRITLLRWMRKLGLKPRRELASLVRDEDNAREAKTGIAVSEEVEREDAAV